MQNELHLWYLENVDMYHFLCPKKMNASAEDLEHDPENQYSKGDFIYFMNQDATHVYLVVSGRVKVGTYSEDGKEIIKAILQPGEVFGEMAVLGVRKRRDFAIAIDDGVSLCAMSLNNMKQLLLDDEDFSLKLTRTIGMKLEKMERRLESLVFKDARTRIIEFVCDIADHKGVFEGNVVQVNDFLTHKDIASLTATSRQTVTSVLNDLREAGLIEFDRKRLRIPNLEKLR